jgi:hypothetical protein
MDRKLGAPLSQSEGFGEEEKYTFPLMGIEASFLDHSACNLSPYRLSYPMSSYDQ